MSVCPICGAENTDGVAVCEKCGRDFSHAEDEVKKAAFPYQVGSDAQASPHDASAVAPEIPNPLRAFVICMKKYANIKGRAGRAELFGFWLICVLIFILYVAICKGVVSYVLHEPSATLEYGFLGIIVVFFLPSLTACVRRLHDLDMSGWILLTFLIPFWGQAQIGHLLGLKGQAESNRYGLPPQRRSNKEVEPKNDE